MLRVLYELGLTTAFPLFRLKGKYPLVPCLPVSAKTECILQDLNQKAQISYSCGAPTFTQNAPESEKTVANIQSAILDK